MVPGPVRRIRSIEGEPNGRCSALAFECAHEVLVFWSAAMLGTTARQLDARLPVLRWTVFDDATWGMRLDAWRQLLTALTCPAAVGDVTGSSGARDGGAVTWHGRSISALEPLDSVASGWRVATDAKGLAITIRALGDGALFWSMDGQAQAPGLTLPYWMDPAAPIRVQSGQGVFCSARFDGWPLAWRRGFLRSLGWPDSTPVNTAAGLDLEVQKHPAMDEWTCRALDLRWAAWPVLRRRVRTMRCPVGLDGISVEQLRLWWPRWQADDANDFGVCS